ncbi:hypothetical protein PBAL39_16154 [Pedobacter sp. BAL39]|uniref:hypothetical protein n=1 Tax=Pedobacter sp. BAL39 TaxID=391596 RepID=UPI00015593BF|nr:hypothetical protein [Pedobacter sp. BAL39]EDM37974.1 hypothetical protein PBAL39_16154 [Pedobacter sp. BAL39]
MIKIFYPEESLDITGWKERLDRIPLKYEFIKDAAAETGRLVDGEKIVEGVPAIEAYLESQEQFALDWYEDRCDKYDFDPDAVPKINLSGAGQNNS